MDAAEAQTVYPRQLPDLPPTGDAWAEGYGPWTAEEQEPWGELHLMPGEPFLPDCRHLLVIRGQCLNCERKAVAQALRSPAPLERRAA